MSKKNSGVDLTKAAAMWSRGASVTEIGAEFGVTRNTISGLTNRNRNLFPHRNATPVVPRSEWIERIDIAEMSQLWANNWALSSIAHRYGITRVNADTVVRERRDLFPKRERGMSAMRAKPITPKQRLEHIQQSRMDEVQATKNRVTEYDIRRLDCAKPLHELERDECKWPIGEDRPFIFCGANTRSGEMWCNHHQLRVYTKRAA